MHLLVCKSMTMPRSVKHPYSTNLGFIVQLYIFTEYINHNMYIYKGIAELVAILYMHTNTHTHTHSHKHAHSNTHTHTHTL